MRLSRSLIAAACLALLSGPLARAETLRLVTLDSPPLEFVRDGRAVGINVDLAQTALASMGLESTVLFVPWRRALAMVQEGAADAIIDAGRNPEREAYLHYPDENIYEEQIFAFKARERDITLDEGLANAGEFSVGTGRGFYYGEFLDSKLRAGAFKSVDEASEMELVIRKVLAGRMDIIVGVLLAIEHLARRIEDGHRLVIVKKTGTDQDYQLGSSKTYLAFSRKTQTAGRARAFSEVLSRLKKDGTAARIEARYR